MLHTDAEEKEDDAAELALTRLIDLAAEKHMSGPGSDEFAENRLQWLLVRCGNAGRLGNRLVSMNRWDEAETAYRRGVAVGRAGLGPEFDAGARGVKSAYDSDDEDFGGSEHKDELRAFETKARVQLLELLFRVQGHFTLVLRHQGKLDEMVEVHGA